MAVKDYQPYIHYKTENIYYLLTIALPITHMPQTENFGRASAFHTELEEEIEIFNIGDVVFTEKDEYLVLYQREDDGQVWAKPVDMFFSDVEVNGVNVKRFEPLDELED
jgi:Protein of unknown function (DUF1653)